MSNKDFEYNDRYDEIIYCVFCDENYKHQNTFDHKNSKSHIFKRLAMLHNIPKQSEFCNSDEECPHLIEEDSDWWCGIGFESVYGKRGELRTGKEFMENERKPRRPTECTLAKPRRLKKKPSSSQIKFGGTKWPSNLNYYTIKNDEKFINLEERVNGGRSKIRRRRATSTRPNS